MSLNTSEEEHKDYWRLKKHNCKERRNEPRAFRLKKRWKTNFTVKDIDSRMKCKHIKYKIYFRKISKLNIMINLNI